MQHRRSIFKLCICCFVFAEISVTAGAGRSVGAAESSRVFTLQDGSSVHASFLPRATPSDTPP